MQHYPYVDCMMPVMTIMLSLVNGAPRTFSTVSARTHLSTQAAIYKQFSNMHVDTVTHYVHLALIVQSIVLQTHVAYIYLLLHIIYTAGKMS